MPPTLNPTIDSSETSLGGLDASLGRDFPHLRGQPVTRILCRIGVAWARHKVLSVEGAEHLAPEHDPFVLVANHNQRTEAILLPTMMVALRQGRRIHFMADWPMMLVPGVGLIYRCGQVIPVFAKSAKPAFLNVFKRFFLQPGSAWERAGALLDQGLSVGVYPEGTMNRDPERLLRGRPSAARLAIEHGVSVVPVGVRFPTVSGRPIHDQDPMTLHVGAPLEPPGNDAAGSEKARIRDFHARIMQRVSDLSGKGWHPDNPRRNPPRRNPR